MSAFIECPHCKCQHRGARPVDALFSEAAHVLVRAHAMAVADAREYLRSQWLGGALELANWCAGCVFTEITVTSPGAKARAVEHIEEGLQAAGGAQIIQLFPAQRDLLDIDAIHDSERK